MKLKQEKQFLIDIASSFLRCLQADFKLYKENEYDAGYHGGKAYAFSYVLSKFKLLYYTPRINKKNISRIAGVLIYPKQKILADFDGQGNKSYYRIMNKELFDDAIEDIKTAKDRPNPQLAKEITKECPVL